MKWSIVCGLRSERQTRLSALDREQCPRGPKDQHEVGTTLTIEEAHFPHEAEARRIFCLCIRPKRVKCTSCLITTRTQVPPEQMRPISHAKTAWFTRGNNTALHLSSKNGPGSHHEAWPRRRARGLARTRRVCFLAEGRRGLMVAAMRFARCVRLMPFLWGSRSSAEVG